MNRKFSLTILLALVWSIASIAQRTNSAYWNYIEQYKGMAQDQMLRYGIPASITLAQGLLESGAGKSTLAVKANNHFGIKVGTNWTGPYYVMADDRPRDKFRKYNSVAESYEDHSRFLQQRRYSSLFELKSTDYKGWARGLKKCGYATSPTYANRLIGIIEDYQLHQYDKGGGKYTGHTTTKKSATHQHANNHTRTHKRPATTAAPSARELAQQVFFSTHPVTACNGNYYIIVQPGDNLPTLSMMTGVSKRHLRRYNERPKDYVPQAGDILFLQKKRTHADKSFKGIPHIVQGGESMYDIAQHYGIRLSSLYKMNALSPDYMPQPGHMLKVY